MPIDSVNLATDVCDGRVQFPFTTLILLDGRLQLKSGIDPSICGFVNVLTQLFEFWRTIDNIILGILLMNFLLNLAPHFIKVGHILIVLTFSYHKYV